MERLAELGIPAGEVRTLDRYPEVSDGQQPIRFDDNTFAGGRSEHLHPPRLGEHNERVRAWLDEKDAQ